jgi:hypothetical protein
VTIVASGAQPEVLAASETDRPRLEAVLRGLEPADTPDALAPAVDLALGLLRGSPGEAEAGDAALYVFTDRDAASLGLGAQDGAIRVETVGSPKDNAGITALSVHRDIFSAKQQVSAYVTVENFSDRPFSGTLRARLSDREIASLKAPIPAGGAATLKVGEPLPEGAVEIVLEPEDTLAADNRAWAILPGAGTVRIALFTRDDVFAAELREIASAIPHVKLEVYRPEEYGRLDPAGCAAAVFHRCEPEVEPQTNILLVCPPVESRIVHVTGDWVQGAGFLDWDEGHPVGRNLRGLQNVRLSGSRRMETPPWAKEAVVAATTAGDIPLLLCGAYRGRRTAVMGFDIAEVRLSRGENLPALILLLNTLRWLVADERPGIRTGETYEALLPAAGSGKEEARCTVIDPRGREFAERLKPGDPLVFAETDYAGRYLVSGGLARAAFVANLCDRSESDLRRPPQGEDLLSPEKVPAAATLPEAPPPDRTALLLALAFAVLLLEWAAWGMRRRRRGTPAPGRTGEKETVDHET